MSAYIDGHALLEVLAASLIAGAGLVACFALGLLGLSLYQGTILTPATTGSTNGNTAAITGTQRTTGLLLAALCFAVVLAGVALGVYAMLDK